MRSSTVPTLRATAVISLAALMVSSCGMVGDTGAIKDAGRLAIECKTDQALAALDRAEQGGGLGTYLAELERVVFLRDVGRDAEAEKALAAYLSKPEAADTDPAELEQSIQDSLNKLREERRKKTGQDTCP